MSAEPIEEGARPAEATARPAFQPCDYYNRVGARSLMRRLRARGESPLIAQGPMGSVLMSGVGAAHIPPAFWNVAEPQTVANVHELYAAAGAELLITNTLQASAPALERAEISAPMAEVNRMAVDAARRARPQLLVGAMGPCGIEWLREDSAEYRAARDAYRAQATALLMAGVDGLLLETFTSIRDLAPAMRGVQDAADGMPVLVSVTPDASGDLLGDGLNLEGAVVWAEKHGAAAVGINCCSLDDATALAPRLVAAATTPVMLRPNAGDPVLDQENDAYVWPEDPQAFARAAQGWLEAGVRVVGACCGATARTTAALAEAVA